MISLHNIFSIAKYERKTLLRSWFFRIFSILSLLVLFGMNFAMVIQGGGGTGWALRAIPSSIPYFNLLILNVAQAIIAVFLASDFLKRDKKLDTTEVIYMRSMSNGEYIFGKTWGNLQVFLVLNVIVLAMALVFNLLAKNTFVNWSAYVVYLVMISIPTLLFIMGLSFLLMSVIRNQAITFVLILGYIGITLFLLQSKFYYIFDYMAFNIPMLKSEIVGFGNLDLILTHRGIYFLLGVGFIFMTVFMLKRLPQSESSTFISLLFSLIFIVGGSYLAFKHVGRFTGAEKLRAQAIELNNQYVKFPAPKTEKVVLSLEHKGDGLAIKAAMTVKNNTTSPLSKLVLSLNNGFNVSELKINGSSTPFERTLHLIVVNGVNIQPDAEVNIEMMYEGSVDEKLCYLDIDEKTIQKKYGSFVINVDKRYAFVSSDYVLLTPEVNWYPQTGVTFSSENVGWYKTEFIDFSLDVKTDPSLKAISQGQVKETAAGQYSFNIGHPLTQISLAIGDYEYKKAQEKGVEFSIWYLKGHDFFSEFFEPIKDTLAKVAVERLEDFERTYDLTFAFDRISLIEVPAQFKTFERIWSSSQETMQPEQVYIAEKGFMLSQFDFENQTKMMQQMGSRGGMSQSLTPEEQKLQSFNNFIGTFTSEQGRPNFRNTGAGNISVTEAASPYFIFPMIYKFQNNISSARWPITNRVFEAYLKSQVQDMRSMFMRNQGGISEDEMANIALQDSSFAEILANTAQQTIIDNVIKLKGDILFSIIQRQSGDTEFTDYLRQLINNNKFADIPFEDFDNGIKEKFGVELTPIMEDWFNKKSLPGYIFSTVKAVKVKTEEMMMTMVTFQVTNFSETEGILKTTFRLSGFGGGGFGGFGGGGFGSTNTIDKILYLAPRQTKEVSYLLESDPRNMSINTMTSKNIPQTITQNFREIVEDPKASPFDGEKILDKPVAIALPNEIIVDNEDPEFEVTSEGNSSLLQKWLKNDDAGTSKYSGYNTYHPPTQWTLTTNSEFFGQYVRSGYYVKSGDGSMKAKWHVPVKESGYYEVYYYLYRSRNMSRPGAGGGPGGAGGGPGGGGGAGGMAGGGNRQEQKGEYMFTIHNDNGAEETTLDNATAEDGWNHIGSYYFSPDNAVIELSNKSELPTINADAVKFVKL